MDHSTRAKYRRKAEVSGALVVAVIASSVATGLFASGVLATFLLIALVIAGILLNSNSYYCGIRAGQNMTDEEVQNERLEMF